MSDMTSKDWYCHKDEAEAPETPWTAVLPIFGFPCVFVEFKIVVDFYTTPVPKNSQGAHGYAMTVIW